MDNIFESIKTWIESTISETVDKLVAMKVAEAEATLLNKKEASQLLRVSTDLFDKEYRYLDGFPKELPGKRWSKSALIAWINNQN